MNIKNDLSTFLPQVYSEVQVGLRYTVENRWVHGALLLAVDGERISSVKRKDGCVVLLFLTCKCFCFLDSCCFAGPGVLFISPAVLYPSDDSHLNVKKPTSFLETGQFFL